MNHAEIQAQLYEFVRGELSPEQRRQLEEHLALCRGCRGEVEVLTSAFASLPPGSRRASGERDDLYWENFASLVQQRIGRTPRHASIGEALRGLIAPVRQSRWSPAAAAAGVLALIVLAFGLWFIGRAPVVAEDPDIGPAPALRASSQQAVGDYLTSSRMLLIGFANMSTEKGEPVDLGVERTAARSLIRQARLLSEEPLDERSQKLIQELERILIELANLEETADIPEIEMIRTGVRQQNLLFKIRMAENTLGR